MVSGMHKLDALPRLLEAEPFDGMLVSTRTKQATVELAEKLEARGCAAAPLNGDIPQPQRERTVARLKAGQIDIVVATDVAARGLDVERIGHVVNYDVPYDTESYVHRIGRTGRAGRKGEAILFIAPRERNMLRTIERRGHGAPGRRGAQAPSQIRREPHGNFSDRSRVGTWNQARQHRRRHCQRVGHRGSTHRPRRYSGGSQLRRPAGRHAETDIQGFAEGACGGP